MPYKCKGIIETVAEDDFSITDDDYDFGDFTDSGKRQQSDSLNNNYGDSIRMTSPTVSAATNTSFSLSTSSTGDEVSVQEMDRFIQQTVVLLQDRLRSARHEGGALLHCSAVYLPPALLQRIAEDVVRMARYEPGGLRGCVITLAVARRKGQGRDLESSTSLGRLESGSELVSTFELQLTLVEDAQSWPSMGDLISLLARKVSGKQLPAPLYISPGYRLVKKRLYRFG